MGVSTSASLLIVFAALFLALGTLYSTGSNAVERITDAEGALQDRAVAIHETAMNITNASYNATADVFTIKATNTGERAIDLDALTVVSDASFVPQDEFETRTVAGRTSRVWRTGQQLVLQDEDGSISSFVTGSSPNAVKLVTREGVASLREVIDLG